MAQTYAIVNVQADGSPVPIFKGAIPIPFYNFQSAPLLHDEHLRCVLGGLNGRTYHIKKCTRRLVSILRDDGQLFVSTEIYGKYNITPRDFPLNTSISAAPHDEIYPTQQGLSESPFILLRHNMGQFYEVLSDLLEEAQSSQMLKHSMTHREWVGRDVWSMPDLQRLVLTDTNVRPTSNGQIQVLKEVPFNHFYTAPGAIGLFIYCTRDTEPTSGTLLFVVCVPVA